MWQTQLAWKEIRQLTPVLVVGLLAVIYCVFGAAGVSLLGSVSYVSELPFYGMTSDVYVPFVGGMLAGLIGFWQTLVESTSGTWLYLWHRPVSRTRITLVKLATGLSLVWLITGVPMLLYLLWALVPGYVAGPVLMINTLMFLKSWFGFSVVYLGCYLAGLRQARWYLTRLIPAVPGILTAFATMCSEYWYWTSIAVIVLVDVVTLYAILIQVEVEDYS